MAIDINKYLELAGKQEKTKEDIDTLLKIVPQALMEGADPHDTLQILWGITRGIRNLDDEEQMDELIRLNHEHTTLIRGELDRALNDYIFLAIYVKIGFAPKVTEAALKVVENPGSSDVNRFAAYSELGNQAYACGMYEKAREYGYRSLEMLDRLSPVEREAYSIVTYGNLITALSSTSRHAEYRDVKAKLLEALQKGIHDPFVKSVFDTVLIDVAVADIRISGYSRERLDTYISRMKDMIIKRDNRSNSFHESNGEMFIFRRMIREGLLKECADLCKLVVDHPNAFIGDFTQFYQIMDILNKKDGTLFTEAELEKYRKGYFELLKKNAEKNKRISEHLVREEFRIFDIDSAYDSMRVKYETDSLTVCYNRPSFEMNAAEFLSKHPGGCVVFIDMDGLKYTNDHFGHSAGDFMLKTFVQVFNNSPDKSMDRLYRYAGDEFILVSAHNIGETQKLMEDIVQKLSAPYPFNNEQILIHFSYGMAEFSESSHPEDPARSVEEVVRLADSRMYECKRRHKEEDPERVRL